MSLHDTTLRAYQATSLSAVSQRWVEEAWETNFCETVSLPDEQEDTLLDVLAWRSVVETTREWAKEEEGSRIEEVTFLDSSLMSRSVARVGFWTVLFDAGVPHKCLLAIIFALLDRGKPRLRDKMCATLAAQLYFILLQVPGTTAYKTFHPMIFQKALDVLLIYPESARVAPVRRGSRTSSTSRRGKRRKSVMEEEEEDDVDSVMDMEEEVCEGEELNPRDKERLKLYLKEVMKELAQLLHCYSLKHHEVTRSQIITAVLRMTRFELSSSSAHMDLSAVKEGSLSLPVHFLSWACLDALCSARHGSLERTLAEVFQQLLPVITMVTSEGGVVTTSSIPLSLTLPSQHALTFVKHLAARCDRSITAPLRTLVQHVCIKTPDRAEYRSRLATTTTQLMGLFTHDHYSNMLDWIYKFSRNTRVPYRVFAMDIVNELMGQPLREVREEERDEIPPEAEFRLSYHFLVKMVLSRCSDRSPSVRAKALSCLASAASCHDNRQLITAVKRAVFSLTATDPLLMNTPAAGSPSAESVVMSMLQRRTSDGKVAVRKAALLALEALTRLHRDGVKEEDVVAIHERCLDPALSVRKQAMISLTALTLENKQCHMMHRLWLDGVLPIVMDPEPGAKDKCLSILEEVLVGGISQKDGEEAEFAWKLLALIDRDDKLDLRRCVRLALQQWFQAGKLPSSFIPLLCSHTSVQGHQLAAWMMLSEASLFTRNINPKFVLDNWKKWVEGNVAMTTEHVQVVIALLTIVGNVAEKLPRPAILDIKDQLLSLLSSFQLPVSVVSAATNTLTLLCLTLTPSQALYQVTLDKWLLNLLHCCEQHLSSTLSSQSRGVDEDTLTSYLFTLGEVAQLCPSHTSPHTGVLVQSLLLATSEAPSSGEGVAISPQLSHFDSLKFSPTLRAHAYITLGKLCLQNEDLAKNSLILMSRELQYSKNAAVKNNIVVALCDLAVRYSAKVDPYISSVSACLKDGSLLVRKQALTLLAHLLQEDYIKWKGSLFYQFVSTLIDEHLCKLTEFCLVQLLLARQPAIFFQHFIECVFHFNGYVKHRVYNQFPQTAREREMFSLAGPENTDKRMTIYQFLLSHMADEHRFQLTTKLCQEVLGGVVDGVITLDDDSTHLIKDTLAILACKDIKLTTLRRVAQDEAAMEGDALGVAMATAQTKIITQIVKKNAMENIVPIVIATKHLLEKERSPLLKDLLMYLNELMQDFRAEIKDILTGDPQLAEEIEFDLRRFEEERKKNVPQPQTPSVATPHAQMVSPLLTPQALGVSAAAAAAGNQVALTPPRLRGSSPNAAPSPSTCHDQDDGGHSTPAVTGPQRGVASPLTVATRAPVVAQPGNGDEIATITTAGKTAQLGETTGKHTHPRLLLSRTPQISLSRLAIMASAKKSMARPHSPRLQATVPATPQGAVSALQNGGPGRSASTPEGLAESISFNVSAVVPPSPIPVNRSVTSYAAALPKTRPQTGTEDGNQDENGGGVNADIVVMPLDKEPSHLPKWNIQ